MLLSYCFFNESSTTEIYTYVHTLSLHDALPISGLAMEQMFQATTDVVDRKMREVWNKSTEIAAIRSEEHTSELQSLMRSSYAVFCLKKKTDHTRKSTSTQARLLCQPVLTHTYNTTQTTIQF